MLNFFSVKRKTNVYPKQYRIWQWVQRPFNFWKTKKTSTQQTTLNKKLIRNFIIERNLFFLAIMMEDGIRLFSPCKGHWPTRGNVFIFDEKTDRNNHPVPSGHPSFAGGELLRSNFVLNATSKHDRSSSSPPAKGEWPQAEGVKQLLPFHGQWPWKTGNSRYNNIKKWA